MKNPLFRKRAAGTAATAQLRSGTRAPFGLLAAGEAAEARLYRAAREQLPILDAAIGKLVRLTGGFTAVTGDDKTDRDLQDFLHTVDCGRAQRGVDAFLTAYLDSLLTYGRAIGEMVVSEGELAALVWGDVTRIRVLDDGNPLHTVLALADGPGAPRPLPQQNLLLFTTLNPDPAHPYGVSLLRGLPYFTGLLQKIYETIGRNWERAGDVRYSVVCRPGSDEDRFSARERAEQMAGEWARAMREDPGGSVSDFVAVGDVDIRVIGADGKALDSSVPVRQLLEQIVAKTGLPPFLLGLSWSTTERMSEQQADLITSELWALRRTVQPMLERICETYLRLHGIGLVPEIVWDEISLQDLAETARAELYHAQAQQIMHSEKG